MDDDPLLTVDQVCLRLQVSKATLGRWRSAGVGPASFLVGDRVRYRRSAVEAYIADQERHAEKRVAGW